MFTVDGSRTDRTVIPAVGGRVNPETASEVDLVCRQWLLPDAGLGSILRAGKEVDRRGGRLLIWVLPARIE